jgi:hypothetical protein
MQIFCRNVNGTHVALNVPVDMSIDDLKAEISRKTGIAPAKQILTYAGLPLGAGRISSYSIQKDCTIVLTVGLPGGARSTP